MFARVCAKFVLADLLTLASTIPVADIAVTIADSTITASRRALAAAPIAVVRRDVLLHVIVVTVSLLRQRRP